MTPAQVFTIAALGGITGILGLALAVLLALGLYAAAARTIEALADRRTLTSYRRQLNALPTTNHHTEDPR